MPKQIGMILRLLLGLVFELAFYHLWFLPKSSHFISGLGEVFYELSTFLVIEIKFDVLKFTPKATLETTFLFRIADAFHVCLISCKEHELMSPCLFFSLFFLVFRNGNNAAQTIGSSHFQSVTIGFSIVFVRLLESHCGDCNA